MTEQVGINNSEVVVSERAESPLSFLHDKNSLLKMRLEASLAPEYQEYYHRQHAALLKCCFSADVTTNEDDKLLQFIIKLQNFNDPQEQLRLFKSYLASCPEEFKLTFLEVTLQFAEKYNAFKFSLLAVKNLINTTNTLSFEMQQTHPFDTSTYNQLVVFANAIQPAISIEKIPSMCEKIAEALQDMSEAMQAKKMREQKEKEKNDDSPDITQFTRTYLANIVTLLATTPEEQSQINQILLKYTQSPNYINMCYANPRDEIQRAIANTSK